MRKKGIPESIKEQVEEIVERFNKKTFKKKDVFYATRYRGDYLYLDRSEYGNSGPICRLKFNGKMDNWDFAIFKYSSERYDPDEWLIPGYEFVDGTVEGAMKAGMKAYPV